MMEKILDLTVERYAALLTSNDADQLKVAYDLLPELYGGSYRNGRGEAFARVVQEIAAYQGGRVLKRLLPSTLGRSFETSLTEGLRHFTYSILALAMLTSSKVVVERYLREGSGPDEKENAREILSRLLRLTVRIARTLQGDRAYSTFRTLVIIPSLECLTNFARGSKIFRNAMKECAENGSIFEQYKALLFAESSADESPASETKMVRFHLASMAVSLAFSADSQMWALDMGLLKLVAAIYEATPLRELSKPSERRRSPAFRCNQILLRLLESKETAEKLRAHNALAGFRPHRRKINGAEPEHNTWALFERRFQGLDEPWGTKLSAEAWKDEEQGWNGYLRVPVVCSWKLCAAGREPLLGKGYSRCSRCQVARYCSKEHQKLHWVTHKVHYETKQGKEVGGVGSVSVIPHCGIRV
ncbi:hypothetical protein KFL_001540280 [Klebsormidium nitens]|uniref:MYND-type domain-containing protein n=1 Tax=Klebsormidium nitens TaxID=105231 RepID=A0A1Y1HY59_KLENI|nr:hypothetical protein KFL_001540280 [Klebsormidium nitens]|eukprot:GAQ83610.1 hypothetical protein KFL_001540280 [Klebsormidium nitens]